VAIRTLQRLTIAAAIVAAGLAPMTASVGADTGDTSESNDVTAASSISMAYHRCLIDSTGAVKCWGWGGGYGAFGNGTKTPDTLLEPTQVSGLTSGWKSISAAGRSSCAVNNSGAAKCWGLNWFGQNGNGTTSNSNHPFFGTSANDNATPVDPVGLTSGVKDISVGYAGACALMNTNSLNCWGHPWSQGTNATAQVNSPQGSPTGLGSNVKTIAAATHTCALQTNGTVSCWGYGAEGQMNNGTSSSLTPVTISIGTTATALTVGEWFSCVVTTAGGAKCWGRNTAGEMGRGTKVGPLTVGDVSGLTSGVLAIAGGGTHACALLSDRTVKCWGSNSSGELGDGTRTERLTPVAVTGLGGEVRTIAAGWDGSCAILMTGAVQCWGQRPGNGTASSLTPVYVTGYSTSGGGGISPQTSQATLSVNTTSGTYGTSLTLGTIGGSGTGSVSYALTAAGTAGCSLSSGSLTPTSSGTCTVTATKASDSNYFEATSSPTTITFSRRSQTVSWTTDTSHQRTASPITLSAAATTGNGALTYSIVSHTTTTCSVVSGTRTLTFTGAGNCVVRATAATSDTHSSDTLDKTFSIIDTVIPTLTLTATNATSSTTTLTFELIGNEPIDCTTATATDFSLTNIDQIDLITQSTALKCTIIATTSVSPGSSGTSTIRSSSSFSVEDMYGNARTTISNGSPSSVVVTIADVTAPVLTLAALNAASSINEIAFTLTGNEAINCLTVTHIDFLYTNISSINSVTQTSPTRCTINATSTIGSGSTGLSTLRNSSQFAVDDAAGNTQTNISTGSPASVSVSVTATTTTSTIASSGSSFTTTTTTNVASGGVSSSQNSTVSTTTTTTLVKSRTDTTANEVPPLAASTISRIPRGRKSAVFIDGKLMNATIKTLDGVIRVTVAGTSSSISASSSNSRVAEISADGYLMLRAGEKITARAQGFAGETSIQLWLYSTPTKLGEGITDQKGAYVTEQTLPESTEPGDHRLVLSAKNVDGKTVTVAFATRVIDRSLIIRVATSPFVWLLLIVLMVLALILPGRLRTRRS
jgi:alpha-tubulin suppressor-like RCC1 family protein